MAESPTRSAELEAVNEKLQDLSALYEADLLELNLEIEKLAGAGVDSAEDIESARSAIAKRAAELPLLQEKELAAMAKEVHAAASLPANAERTQQELARDVVASAELSVIEKLFNGEATAVQLLQAYLKINEVGPALIDDSQAKELGVEARERLSRALLMSPDDVREFAGDVQRSLSAPPQSTRDPVEVIAEAVEEQQPTAESYDEAYRLVRFGGEIAPERLMRMYLRVDEKEMPGDENQLTTLGGMLRKRLQVDLKLSSEAAFLEVVKRTKGALQTDKRDPRVVIKDLLDLETGVTANLDEEDVAAALAAAGDGKNAEGKSSASASAPAPPPPPPTSPSVGAEVAASTPEGSIGEQLSNLRALVAAKVTEVQTAAESERMALVPGVVSLYSRLLDLESQVPDSDPRQKLAVTQEMAVLDSAEVLLKGVIESTLLELAQEKLKVSANSASEEAVEVLEAELSAIEKALESGPTLDDLVALHARLRKLTNGATVDTVPEEIKTLGRQLLSYAKDHGFEQEYMARTDDTVEDPEIIKAALARTEAIHKQVEKLTLGEGEFSLADLGKLADIYVELGQLEDVVPHEAGEIVANINQVLEEYSPLPEGDEDKFAGLNPYENIFELLVTGRIGGLNVDQLAEFRENIGEYFPDEPIPQLKARNDEVEEIEARRLAKKSKARGEATVEVTKEAERQARYAELADRLIPLEGRTIKELSSVEADLEALISLAEEVEETDQTEAKAGEGTLKTAVEGLIELTTHALDKLRKEAAMASEVTDAKSEATKIAEEIVRKSRMSAGPRDAFNEAAAAGVGKLEGSILTLKGKDRDQLQLEQAVSELSEFAERYAASKKQLEITSALLLATRSRVVEQLKRFDRGDEIDSLPDVSATAVQDFKYEEPQDASAIESVYSSAEAHLSNLNTAIEETDAALKELLKIDTQLAKDLASLGTSPEAARIAREIVQEQKKIVYSSDSGVSGGPREAMQEAAALGVGKLEGDKLIVEGEEGHPEQIKFAISQLKEFAEMYAASQKQLEVTTALLFATRARVIDRLEYLGRTSEIGDLPQVDNSSVKDFSYEDPTDAESVEAAYRSMEEYLAGLNAATEQTDAVLKELLEIDDELAKEMVALEKERQEQFAEIVDKVSKILAKKKIDLDALEAALKELEGLRNEVSDKDKIASDKEEGTLKEELAKYIQSVEAAILKLKMEGASEALKGVLRLEAEIMTIPVAEAAELMTAALILLQALEPGEDDHTELTAVIERVHDKFKEARPTEAAEYKRLITEGIDKELKKKEKEKKKAEYEAVANSLKSALAALERHLNSGEALNVWPADLPIDEVSKAIRIARSHGVALTHLDHIFEADERKDLEDQLVALEQSIWDRLSSGYDKSLKAELQKEIGMSDIDLAAELDSFRAKLEDVSGWTVKDYAKFLVEMDQMRVERNAGRSTFELNNVGTMAFDKAQSAGFSRDEILAAYDALQEELRTGGPQIEHEVWTPNPEAERRVEELLAEFSIQPEAIPGFSAGPDQFSPGQRLLLLQGLQKMTLREIEKKAGAELSAEIAAKGSGLLSLPARTWAGIKARGRLRELAKGHKDSLGRSNLGNEAERTLNELAAQMKESRLRPGVNVDSEGNLQFDYLPESFMNNMPDRLKNNCREFNESARAMSAIPSEWGLEAATDDQRKEYRKAKEAYASAKAAILNGIKRQGQGNLPNAIERVALTDGAVELSQFLSTNGEVEAKLKDIDMPGFFSRTGFISRMKDGDFRRSMMRSGFNYAGVNFLGRAVAMGTLGWLVAPAAALLVPPAIVAGRSLYRGNKKAREEIAKHAEQRPFRGEHRFQDRYGTFCY